MSEMNSDHAKLELNAQAFRDDAQLDHAADLFHTDRDAWNQLPREIKTRSGIYADFRDNYRAAVAAGVIPDDRTPTDPAA